ncbi:hypothetical protein ADK70_31910 [Streptomyces rimosus subsp. pseudoverticillatus]|uniref:hypothetical protein n=1 Tax=Streptomyces rimosus TaxID=1927 RepID=UPI0006B27193|nr:hypothetical protein [Streptomyces rimosus]KOT79118.1 hypothetical protein ADK70_31910 [Streptomyces rimosus subsp. pseudoverticillatus]
MSGRPRHALSFDPRALTDLLEAPTDVRGLALEHLQETVNGDMQGGKLTGDLSGLRKLYLDQRAEWRLVYCQRPAPATSQHTTEIHVIAVRPRADFDVYDTVAARLGMERRPMSALAHAARARSPQLTASRPSGEPKPGPGPRPGPALKPSSPANGPTR